ncbi:MAG: hypothetical protein GTN76_03815 [Candidatus Aenigmarchaeota archaeon]|nr:hypothetical protein [Candidatus Aenigmarchaeota archaeon]
MPWEVVKRKEARRRSKRPFISITPSHFFFNSQFVTETELDPDSMRVVIYADAERRRLGFEFVTDGRKDSYALSFMASRRRKSQRKTIQCTARGIVGMYRWVRAVTKLSVGDRRFEPTKEEKLWVIQLPPAFEYSELRAFGNEIPSDAKGIYRYLNEEEEVIFIGKGEIQEDLVSAYRGGKGAWDIVKVEYSPLEDSEQQDKWVRYWLDRHEEEYKRLPKYNHPRIKRPW